jgi:hypothetical protein
MQTVECLSSASYPGRPTAFTWGGERRTVTAIIASSRSPHGIAFRVRAANNQVFELFYDAAAHAWQVTPLTEDS